MSKIKWTDLFELDDETTIDEAISKINEFNKAVQSLVTGMRSSQQALAKEYEMLQTESTELVKDVMKMNLQLEQEAKALEKVAVSAQKLEHQDQALQKAQSDNVKLMADMTKASTTLATAKDTLTKSTTAEANSIADLKKKLSDAEKAYAQMGDATDGAIKTETLNKIKEYSKQINNSTTALKEAKKGVDLAAGSYYELQNRVTDAKKRMKEMEGGMAGSSAEFVKLQKTVKEGSAQLKAFDANIGDHQREVGNYGKALEAADGMTGGFIGRIKQMGTALMALATNPLVLTFMAIVAAIGAAKSALTAFYTTTAEGQDVAEKNSMVWDSFFALMQRGWAETGKSISEFFGGVKEWIAGAAMSLGLYDLAGKIIAVGTLAEQAADKFAHLWKEHIRDRVDDANTELKVNELLEVSRDKAHQTDKRRLAALREANGLLKEQLEGDIDLAKQDIDAEKDRLRSLGGRITLTKTLAEYTDEELLATGLKKEQLQHLADLEVALVKIQSDASAKRKTMLKQETQLIFEIEKERKAAAERLVTAQRDLDVVKLNADIKYNEELIAISEKGSEEQIALMQQHAQMQRDLMKINRDKDIHMAEEAARARIEAEGREVTDALLASDQALATERLRIEETYSEGVRQINVKLMDDLQNNVFTMLANDLTKLTNQVKTQGNDQLTALAQAYQKGEISAREYMQQRSQIDDQLQETLATNSLNGLEKQLAALKKFGLDTTAIEQQISDAKRQIAEKDVEDSIARQEKLKQAYIQAAMSVFTGITQLGRDYYASEEAEAQHRLDMINTNYSNDVKLAGDNAAQKAAIDEKYRVQRKKAEADELAVRRKRAAFEKSLAAVQIVINTAQAIARTIAEVPKFDFGISTGVLVGIYSALGAAQLAAVLSKPIPAYEEGTDYAAGGLSLIGERGAEIVQTPSGKTRVAGTDGPQLMNIERGSKVFTAEETNRMLRDGDMAMAVSRSFEGSASRIETQRDNITREMLERLYGQLESLEATVANKKEFHVNITEEGVQLAVQHGHNLTKYLGKHYA